MPSMYKLFVAFSLGIGSLAYGLKLLWGPLLYENATASAPIGIYYRTFDQELRKGDYTIVALPLDLPSYGCKKGHLLLKKVAAMPGEAYEITEDGLVVKNASGKPNKTYKIYRSKKLPQLPYGSFVVPEGSLLFLNEPDTSLDSRYLGPIAKEKIVARVSLLIER